VYGWYCDNSVLLEDLGVYLTMHAWLNTEENALEPITAECRLDSFH